MRVSEMRAQLDACGRYERGLQLNGYGFNWTRVGTGRVFVMQGLKNT